MAELEPLVEAEGYLTIRALRTDWGKTIGAKLIKVTQRYPETLDGDDIVIKLRVRVPVSKWSAPEVQLDVPEDALDDIEATNGVAEEEEQ